MSPLTRKLSAVCLALSVACRSSLDARRNHVDGQILMSLVSSLAADSMEGRGAGYPGEARAAHLIAQHFSALGLEPARLNVPGDTAFLQIFGFVPRHPIAPWTTLTSRNVIGYLRGDDPHLRNEIVVLGAHHDGQGQEGEADPGRSPSIDATAEDRIWNSADDNATGTATVMEIARTIVTKQLRHRRTIAFVTFGAEEHGLNGSIEYVNAPPRTLARHVAMINVEKIGRESSKPLIAASTGTGTSWRALLASVDSTTESNVPALLDEMIYDTDHYPFAARGIPAIVLGVVHEIDTHRPGDKTEKIDPATFVRRADYVLAMVLELANGSRVPRFHDNLGFDPGVSTVAPTDSELVVRGLPARTPALKVSGVIGGRPGAIGGLLPGDLVVEVGERPVLVATGDKNPLQTAAKASAGALSIVVLRDRRKIRLEIVRTETAVTRAAAQ